MLLAAAIMFARDGYWWYFGIALIAPDLAMLAGVGSKWEQGRMPPRAVPFYNAAHRVGGPIALLASSLLLGRAWTVAALAWGAHICIDRTLGYNLRNRDGTIRPG